MEENKTLAAEIMLTASVKDVWDKWTTAAGIQSFFSKNCHIDFRFKGAFEMYFLMDQPEGSRGAEGCQYLSYLPNEFLSFSWNFPPHLTNLRSSNAQTFVVLTFEKKSETETVLKLNQMGWQKGAEWEEGYQYFQAAWPIVLNNLKASF